jgi:hypothetical protein
MLNNNLLSGKLVRLAAIDPETTGAAWAKWRMNSEYSRLADMDPVTVNSPKSTREWIEKHLDDWLSHGFQIRTIAGDQFIGDLGLEGDMKVHGDAFVGIAIGDRSFGAKAMAQRR